MGKGGGDPTYYRPGYWSGRAQPHRVSSTTSSEKFGGNATTAAVDGLQFPPGSSASQSQHPAGSSVGVEAGQDTELAAKSGLPYSVVLDEGPKISGQGTGRATSGVPNPDSEGLGGRNEGSEEALVVQLHGALHGPEELDRAARVARNTIAALHRFVRYLDYLRQKPCEYSLPNGEKAGKSSDALYAKRKKLWVSKNFPGVRQRGDSFVSEIHLPGKKNKFWLGTFKTAEAAAQARGAAANWLATHSGTEFLDDEHRNELKKCAKEAGEHLSDDRSHHKVGLAVLVENLEKEATTLASLKGKAVASAEHVIQWESSAQENPFSSSEFEEKATTLASLKRKAVASAEHVSQWESPAQENPISPSEFQEKATTLASLKGKAVASAEHVSQWESPAQENPISPSEFQEKATTLASLKGKAVASAEHVSQWESPAQENPISPSEFQEKATTLASLKGKAVASAEHVSQWESLASENPRSPIEFVDWVSNLFKL